MQVLVLYGLGLFTSGLSMFSIIGGLIILSMTHDSSAWTLRLLKVCCLAALVFAVYLSLQVFATQNIGNYGALYSIPGNILFFGAPFFVAALVADLINYRRNSI